MAETKTCKNCKRWDDHYPYTPHFEMEGIIERRIVGYCTIEGDDSDLVTSHDFGCTKFEPKGDLK